MPVTEVASNYKVSKLIWIFHTLHFWRLYLTSYFQFKYGLRNIIRILKSMLFRPCFVRNLSLCYHSSCWLSLRTTMSCRDRRYRVEQSYARHINRWPIRSQGFIRIPIRLPEFFCTIWSITTDSLSVIILQVRRQFFLLSYNKNIFCQLTWYGGRTARPGDLFELNHEAFPAAFLVALKSQCHRVLTGTELELFCKKWESFAK